MARRTTLALTSGVPPMPDAAVRPVAVVPGSTAWNIRKPADAALRNRPPV
ncbi:hypothetical protein AB0F30_25440 [Streptomyces sp. NPDC029006]